MSHQLSRAERAKFEIFFGGIAISKAAEEYVMKPYGQRPLTLADYASTSGVSLVLDHNVWVNAPIAQYNENFVFEPKYDLIFDGNGLILRNREERWDVPAQFVPVPAYFNERTEAGDLFTEFVHTHTDRARLSPVRGCAMRCKFCDIPYEFKGRYLPKPIDRLIEAARRAINDPVQPAAHFLISGGTPGARDYEYLRQTYLTLIKEFSEVHFDIMMAPMPELLDLDELDKAGVGELSMNVELWDPEVAARIMPEKFRQGRTAYLDFIARSVDKLGTHRVRSILIVGLETKESTLEGVEALAKVGCATVLSPFRPDPITELATHPPPTPDEMIDVYWRARAISEKYGLKLGPKCTPCSHNTLTLDDGSGAYGYHAKRPNVL